MICIKCGDRFEAGRSSSEWCSKCRKTERGKAWRKNNPEKHKALVKKWNDKVSLKIKGKKTLELKCLNPECKKTFRNYSARKFCSDQCRHFYHNHKEDLENGVIVNRKRGPKTNPFGRKTRRQKQIGCNVHDSELTQRGSKRKNIYIGCSNGLTYEAKRQALLDFTKDKRSINNIEKIKPFKRLAHDDILLERQEHADAAFQYMRYIL